MKGVTKLIMCLAIILVIGLTFTTNGLASETKVKFYVNWVYSYADHIALYVAKDKGFFKEQGLDITFEHVKGSNAVLKVIGAKKDDLAFGMAGALAVLQGVIRGIPIKSVTALYQANPTAIISLKKNNINSVEDLAGKSLADSPTSTTYYFIKAGIAKSGLDFDKVKFLAVENRAKESLLLVGKIDAMAGTANGQAVNIAAKGHEVNLITMQDLGIKGYGMCIVASNSMLKQKDTIDKFLNAYAKGILFQRNNPDAASEIFQKMVPERTLSIVKQKNLDS